MAQEGAAPAPHFPRNTPATGQSWSYAASSEALALGSKLEREEAGWCVAKTDNSVPLQSPLETGGEKEGCHSLC